MIFGMIVTSVSSSKTDETQTLIIAICLWGLLGCTRNSLALFRERFEIHNLDYELYRHLSRISLEKFFSISMGQHHAGHSIIKRSIMSKGEAAVAGIVNMGIYELVPTILMVFIPLGLLLVKVPIIGACVIFVIICYAIYTVKYNTSFSPRLRKLDTLSNTVSKKRGEVIENADLVFANAQEERVRRECDEEKNTEGLQGKPVWLSYGVCFYGGQFFLIISQTLCIAISAYLARKGTITPGTFVAVVIWIGSALGTLTNISHVQRNLMKNLAPVSKYFRFLDYQPDILMPDKPVPIENLQGRIEFRHVSFTYRKRTDKDSLNDDEGEETSTKEHQEIPALQDISLVLDPGKRYAFVGPSGAGKSTLIGLVLRAYDSQAGHVLIDGVDIRMLDYRELRRNIGLVPQDVALFDGSMRYNITFGLNGSADKVTNEQLDHISKLSRVSEFSNKLENGWDTLVGERGLKLSGGQRQRVGIARALIKNPQILIFDEATSSLDTENEAIIRESIREASVGKTTIIIAHRLATVKDVDKIFVFDEGKLVEQGSHEELVQKDGYYRRLVHNQVILA